MLKHSIIVSRVCGGARKIKLLDVVDFDMIMTHLCARMIIAASH